MHFEILVEDASGKIALDHFMTKILGLHGEPHTWRITNYQGVGHLPKNLRTATDAKTRVLLNNLPPMLRAYGKTFRSYGPGYPAAVIVVCDLDIRDRDAFVKQLEDLLAACDPRPNTLFRLAIEEGEAWLLGDRAAIEQAYPHAKTAVLDAYVQDSICGTWEVMADAVHPKGAADLRQKGYPEAGRIKCEWARNIAPHVDVDRNRSPSFKHLRDGIRDLVRGPS